MILVHAWAILSIEKITYSLSSSQNLKLSNVLSGWNQTFFVILSDVSSAKVGSTSPPTTWSVDEVVKFIEKSDLAEHADMFKKHVSKFAERKLHLICILYPPWKFSKKSQEQVMNTNLPFQHPPSPFSPDPTALGNSWQAFTPRKAEKLGWGKSSQQRDAKTTFGVGLTPFGHTVMAETPSPFRPEILLKFCLL